MSKLTDKERKQIIADRADGLSFRRLARKYHVSTTTIQKTLKRDPTVTQKVMQKKEQNTADLLSYMDSKRAVVCEIIDKGLTILNDPDKLAHATPAQITTALGTLIDKWTGAAQANVIVNNQIHIASTEIRTLSNAALEELAGARENDA